MLSEDRAATFCDILILLWHLLPNYDTVTLVACCVPWGTPIGDINTPSR
jgi:hypothetical protein